MILEEIKNIKSGNREIRKFGVSVGIVIGLLGMLFLWRGNDYYPWFMVISGALIVLGLVTPVVLKPIYKFWMTLAMVDDATYTVCVILFYFNSHWSFGQIVRQGIY